MKYWEFLIQKEGDQTWLPLETQQVEILEGRYRVVAHSDRVNTPMEIRVSQLVTDELPPRKRIRKRIAETNEAGLVVVMPFVNLKPGRWELTCSSFNVMDDDTINRNAANGVTEGGWQYKVQLQVFAHTGEDWSGEWPVPEDSQSTASVILEDGENAVDLALVNQDLPLIQAQAELETRLQLQGLATLPTRQGDEADFFSYQVALKQQAYLARHDQPMTIMGKVNALSDNALSNRLLENTSQLWIRLQNPETAQVIMEAHRPLSLARLPADFKVQIQLPAEVTTRVILGEVSLRTVALDAAEKAKVLASTAFTITAGIAQLLDSIASQELSAFEEEISLLSGTNAAARSEARSKADKEPALIETSLTGASLYSIPNSMQNNFVPAVGVVLPPLLNLSDFERDSSETSQLDLPDFATAADGAAANLIVSDGPASNGSASNGSADNGSASNGFASHGPSDRTPPQFNTPIEPAPMVSQPAQFLGTSIEDGDLEADEISAVLEDIDYDLRSEASELDALEAPGIEGALALPIRSAVNPPAARDAARDAARELEEQTAQAFSAEQPDESLNESLNDSTNEIHPLTSPLARPELRFDRKASARPAAHSANEPSTERRQANEQIEANIDFQALKLKDHFWKRLSTLTHESHKEAAQISQRMKDAGVSRGQSAMLSAPSSFEHSFEHSFEQNSEVVIYDEPTDATRRNDATQIPQSASRRSQRLGRQPQQPSLQRPEFQRANLQRSDVHQGSQGGSQDTQDMQGSRAGAAQPPSMGRSMRGAIAQEDLPEMALPVISVPMGDLIAGEVITVTVRTRPSMFKPFIKLWMIDRQSRSLVIEPQLLTHLLPDALGDLEATTEMRIPMDCLDVQIAAIAVDMATQQESNKAIVNRHVVHANQSSSGQGFNF